LAVYLYLLRFRGVRLNNQRTEIIPFEPDAAYTAEGKSEMEFTNHSWSITFYGMDFTLNNQPKSLNENSISVMQLLDMEMPGRQKGIAVAINNKIVPKTDWEKTIVLQHDSVLIIKATQGG
jgi:sulfur carrier protein